MGRHDYGEPIRAALDSLWADVERARHENDVDTFGDVATRGFEMPEVFGPLFVGLVGKPDWHVHLAYDGPEAVATGAAISTASSLEGASQLRADGCELRHTFDSLQVAAGPPQRVVSDLLGQVNTGAPTTRPSADDGERRAYRETQP